MTITHDRADEAVFCFVKRHLNRRLFYGYGDFTDIGLHNIFSFYSGVRCHLYPDAREKTNPLLLQGEGMPVVSKNTLNL